jgi:histidine ammonia-lyase
MGATAVRHAGQILEHVETIVAIELLLAAQGVDLRGQAMEIGVDGLGEGTSVAYQLIRERAPFIDCDVVLSPLIQQVRGLVAGGAIKRAVEERLGLE